MPSLDPHSTSHSSSSCTPRNYPAGTPNGECVYLRAPLRSNRDRNTGKIYPEQRKSK
ncbi:hypothetical protein IQ244_03405 [Nostoc sp. LEGE 06077]|uniref:hypothetical protein n=1 Tax=Nostoc sp. LEGE 06077 TaxID=915325 RepID=UPI0019DE5E4F|nr:hypothetical protein [Nostoc sp. LEGE 06077]MBE9205570.1 hypothetical protein [Nostoc sp. LEGE 06077]